MSTVRRVAVVTAVAAAATVALGVPSAQADVDETFGPVPTNVVCISSQGTDIACLQGTARVQATQPGTADTTLTATLTLDLHCTGSVGCQPIHQVVSVPRTGIVRGTPTVGSARLLTIPANMLCVGEEGAEDCVPGIEIPVDGPTVTGTIATVWINGTAIPVEVPDEVPTPDVDGLVDIAEAVANNVLRRLGTGIEIHIQD